MRLWPRQIELPASTETYISSFIVEDDSKNHVISLVAGDGDTDNDLFEVSTTKLFLKQPIDTEQTKSIRVNINDGEFDFEKTLQIKFGGEITHEGAIGLLVTGIYHSAVGSTGEFFNFSVSNWNDAFDPDMALEADGENTAAADNVQYVYQYRNGALIYQGYIFASNTNKYGISGRYLVGSDPDSPDGVTYHTGSGDFEIGDILSPRIVQDPQSLVVTSSDEDSADENQPPVGELSAFDPTLKEGSTYTFTVTATDFNNDPIDFAVLSPRNTTIINNGNGTATITWSVQPHQIGRNKLIVEISDRLNKVTFQVMCMWKMYSMIQ